MVAGAIETNEFVEGRLKFKFPKHWLVEKYDAQQGFVSTELRQLQAFKAVDFLILNANVLTLVEVKEFQGDPYPNTLDNVVVQKTRDTILGLLLAWRMKDDSTNDENFTKQYDKLKVFVEHVITPGTEIRLIFLLDSIQDGMSQLDRDDLHDLDQSISCRVKPIVAQYQLFNIDEFQKTIADVELIGQNNCSAVVPV